jgi:hypothetical protein
MIVPIVLFVIPVKIREFALQHLIRRVGHAEPFLGGVEHGASDVQDIRAHLVIPGVLVTLQRLVARISVLIGVRLGIFVVTFRIHDFGPIDALEVKIYVDDSPVPLEAFQESAFPPLLERLGLGLVG